MLKAKVLFLLSSLKIPKILVPDCKIHVLLPVFRIFPWLVQLCRHYLRKLFSFLKMVVLGKMNELNFGFVVAVHKWRQPGAADSEQDCANPVPDKAATRLGHRQGHGVSP